jgi:hypothetical protein
MSTLDLNELQAPLKEKEKIKNDIYDKILVRVHNRIKLVSRHAETFSYFVIPKFVLGIPMYNFDQCKHYIINSLTENGLAVNYIDPNLLYISWDIEHLHSKHIPTIPNDQQQQQYQQHQQQQEEQQVGSSLNYMAPVQQQVYQPVQQQMQQDFRNTQDFIPTGLFGTPMSKLG